MTQYQPPQEQPSQPYPQPPSQLFYQPPQQYPQMPMQPQQPRKRRSPLLPGCGIAAGLVILVINVTLKNTDSSAQTASSLGVFALKDSTGQTYNQDIIYGGSPDGNVATEGVIRGDVTYQVPQKITSYTLQFTTSLDASQLVEWQIKD